MAGAPVQSTIQFGLPRSESLGGVPFSAFVDERSLGSDHAADADPERSFRTPAIPILANERNVAPASGRTGD